MVVQHNLTAMNANRYLGINNSKLSKSLEKLSSGYAINRAGDNAAGLAVSEKMRSQIAGMTQGVKNAQDGISMVQTFEGALTETDSILQRMKTLADQMANGSYDDPIDRTAAQQEFLQLNDELDQIADTDFNGVIVLNGGKMADGLEAVDGMFDYANKAGQVAAANAKALADAQAAAQKKIDSAQKSFDNAKAAYNATSNRDLCIEGNAVKWNELDDNKYTTGVAKDLFDKATVGAGGTDSLNSKNVESFNVQYVFDGSAWKVASQTNIAAVQDADGNAVGKDIIVGKDTVTTGAWYVDDDGNTVEVDISASDITDANIATTANGGFVVNNSKLGNAIFASKDAKAGDVVTLTYTNTAQASYAPTNIGMDEESLVDRVGLADKPVLTLSDDAKNNSNMNQEMQDALIKLDNSNIEFLYTKDGIEASIDNEDLIIEKGDIGTDSTEFKVSFKNQDGKQIELATVTMQNSHDASAIKAKGSAAAKNGAATAATATTGVGATDAYAAKETTLVYKEGAWVNIDGSAFDLATGANNGYGVDLSNSVKKGAWFTGDPQEGDKITFGYDAGTGATANVNVKKYTPSANASFTDTTTAATSTEDLELTWNGSAWAKGNGTAIVEGTDTVGGITIPTGAIANLVDTTNGNPVKGDKLTLSATLGSKVVTASVKASDATVGKVTFGVALDEGKYDPSSMGPTIDTAKSPNGTDSRSIDKAYEDAKTALAEAKAAYPKTVDDLGEEYKVSKSDAFDKSEAQLTYKDSITLQTGARTKDAVNFTFQYNSDAIGDLKADLNCTAKGLGTSELNLSTQEAANYAIDKIDQAINKVSLVRGTFGAIQNRLEHKIDNMNVSIENLTSAESQIRDTDMPTEMMNFTKQQILAQASQSMLAQANQLPQSVLSLLQ